MFKNGGTSIADDERSGRLSTSITERNIERVHAMILENRRVNIDEVVHYLRISHGYAHGIIQDRIGFHKVGARWVTKKKQMRA
jgi:hypothetical protein